MVVIILPKWYEKAKKSIDENIINIAIKNDIPLDFVEDSKTIDEAKSSIMNTLVNIDENCKVEERERLKEFVEEMENTTTKSS